MSTFEGFGLEGFGFEGVGLEGFNVYRYLKGVCSLSKCSQAHTRAHTHTHRVLAMASTDREGMATEDQSSTLTVQQPPSLRSEIMNVLKGQSPLTDLQLDQTFINQNDFAVSYDLLWEYVEVKGHVSLDQSGDSNCCNYSLSRLTSTF